MLDRKSVQSIPSRKEIIKTYHGVEVPFTGEAWFNATKAAAKFGKKPHEWLRSKAAKEFISAAQKYLANNGLQQSSGNFPLISGNSNPRRIVLKSLVRTKTKSGTWLHPELGVPFACWLSADFAVWCARQIKEILIGTLDVKRARHKASVSYRVMQDMLKFKREAQGKLTETHHYVNEARLITWCLTGQYTALDRDSLSLAELDILAALEERNIVLIGAEVPYPFRKEILAEFVKKLSVPALAADSTGET